jgi:hypothetical protein
MGRRYNKSFVKICRRGRCAGEEDVQERKMCRRGRCAGEEDVQERKICRRGRFAGEEDVQERKMCRRGRCAGEEDVRTVRATQTHGGAEATATRFTPRLHPDLASPSQFLVTFTLS